MTFTTPARIEAQDRRLAAIHEAGHVITQRRLGFIGSEAAIWPSGTTNRLEEMSWVGRTYFTPLRSKKSARRKMAMQALAGSIAEAVWEDRFSRNLDLAAPNGATILWNEAYEWLFDLKFMPPSDWRHADYAPGNPQLWHVRLACETCRLLQGELWPALIQEARRLIVCHGRGDSDPYRQDVRVELTCLPHTENPLKTTPSNLNNHGL